MRNIRGRFIDIRKGGYYDDYPNGCICKECGSEVEIKSAVHMFCPKCGWVAKEHVIKRR